MAPKCTNSMNILLEWIIDSSDTAPLFGSNSVIISSFAIALYFSKFSAFAYFCLNFFSSINIR